MEEINIETNSLVNNSPTTITTPRKKDDFYILAELGEGFSLKFLFYKIILGSYSSVYLASEKTSSNKFAIKVCSKRKIQREKKVFYFFDLFSLIVYSIGDFKIIFFNEVISVRN